MARYYEEYPAYVSAEERRRRAQGEAEKRTRKGATLAPIAITGRKIATTFWGGAWCDHLEGHSDYESRLPRGRTYVRSGAVLDLQIAKGRVTALVHGSAPYEVSVAIAPLAERRWAGIVQTCGGKIESLVELLQGKLSRAVMEVVTDRDAGLFPAPEEIKLDCSCPDHALMCKHVAAALYGVGARLDASPDLLFLLRGVDHLALIEGAGRGRPSGAPGEAQTHTHAHKRIARADLADVFGIDLEVEPPPKTRQRSRR